MNFSLPKEGKVNLIIYDILGREVRRLLNNEFKTAGIYSMEFNGAGLSSGVYFYKLTSETISGGKEFSVTKRIVLIK
ncbi:MAG: T9SS type A sorting domain-containing protein [Ignavibacteria bacterium]